VLIDTVISPAAGFVMYVNFPATFVPMKTASESIVCSPGSKFRLTSI